MGWAFKKDTNDTRESAAINIAQNLINEQANIAIYDPKVSEKQIRIDLVDLDENQLKLIDVNKDPYEACHNSHAIAVLTEWDEFSTYDWKKIYNNMLKPAFVFDGRNILDKNKMKEIGFTYIAVGSSSL